MNQKILIVVAFIIGGVLGFVIANSQDAVRATPQEYESAKNQISELLKDRIVEGCPHPDFPQYDDNMNGFIINYRYLRFNSTLNRAIISDCSNTDKLLVKNNQNEWLETTVNLTINNRVNPVWQKACLIEDITVSDDTIRPENSSIDEYNLEECNHYINQ